jgi:hypothetical protein
MISGFNSLNSGGSGGVAGATTTLVLTSADNVLTPTLTGQVSNPNGGTSNGLTVTVYADRPSANTVLGTATTDSTGAWSYTHASSLTAGLVYNFHARVTLTARSTTLTQTFTASGTAPVNTVAPAVTGTPAVGQTLTISNGSWTGSPTPTFTRQWQVETTVNSGSYQDIAGATNTTYVVQAADNGKRLRGLVTANNTAGSVTATSNALLIPFTSEYQGISGLVASWEWDKGAQTQTYNGNVVLGYLPDVSGNAYHASQPQLQFNPLYDAANGITFGPDMFLQVLQTANLLSGVSGYTVLYNGTINVGATSKAVLGISRVNGSTPHLGLFSVSGTSSNRMRYQGLNALTGSDLSSLSTTGVTLATSQKLCWTVDFANNLVNFYVNGVANGSISTAFTGGSVSPTGSPQSIVLGADSTITTSGTANNWQTPDLVNKAYMKKCHIFNRVLTPTEVAAL